MAASHCRGTDQEPVARKPDGRHGQGNERRHEEAALGHPLAGLGRDASCPGAGRPRGASPLRAAETPPWQIDGHDRDRDREKHEGYNADPSHERGVVEVGAEPRPCSRQSERQAHQQIGPQNREQQQQRKIRHQGQQIDEEVAKECSGECPRVGREQPDVRREVIAEPAEVSNRLRIAGRDVCFGRGVRTGELDHHPGKTFRVAMNPRRQPRADVAATRDG